MVLILAACIGIRLYSSKYSWHRHLNHTNYPSMPSDPFVVASTDWLCSEATVFIREFFLYCRKCLFSRLPIYPGLIFALLKYIFSIFVILTLKNPIFSLKVSPYVPYPLLSFPRSLFAARNVESIGTPLRLSSWFRPLLYRWRTVATSHNGCFHQPSILNLRYFELEKAKQ